ncbi:transporter [Halobellus sp. GM3]|uniref:transporter n=1 Tax=Halobellus sp. GM3 TaxID=3458410 RepID=UPI00403DAFF2
MSRPESAPTSRTDRAVDGRTLGVAAALGGLAYLLSYAITYAATGQQISNSLAARVLEIATGDPGTWQIVGWVFYNAHFVTAEIPGLFGSTAVNLVGRGDTFSPALFALPPVVLALAGALVAVATRPATPLSGAIGGAAVTLGYLPLAVGGAFVFTLSVGDATAGPTLATAILLAGLVYPLVFGALGGAVGSMVSSGRE